MGVCASAPSTDDNDAQNAMLDEQLKMERLQSLFVFKILLLGAGEAGKSTIVKQMRLIHHKTPNEAELATIAVTLHSNVIDIMTSIFSAAEKFEIKLDAEDLVVKQRIEEHEANTLIDVEFGKLLAAFVDSPAFAAVMVRRSEFWLLDSTNYCLEHLERFCQPGFRPLPEDTVQCRIRTTGIDVSRLEWKSPDPVEGEPDHIQLHIVDVGGQRTERSKWMHCFEDVKCIIFVVNLAGYDQVLFEDPTQNRMTESLEVLHQTASLEIFQDTPMYIFLNKSDLFKYMIKNRPLSKRFPEYKGGPDFQAAIEFITERFKEEFPEEKRSSVKVFTVTGVSTGSITDSFMEVKKDLFKIMRPKINAEKLKIFEEN